MAIRNLVLLPSTAAGQYTDSTGHTFYDLSLTQLNTLRDGDPANGILTGGGGWTESTLWSEFTFQKPVHLDKVVVRAYGQSTTAGGGVGSTELYIDLYQQGVGYVRIHSEVGPVNSVVGSRTVDIVELGSWDNITKIKVYIRVHASSLGGSWCFTEQYEVQALQLRAGRYGVVF